VSGHRTSRTPCSRKSPCLKIHIRALYQLLKSKSFFVASRPMSRGRKLFCGLPPTLCDWRLLSSEPELAAKPIHNLVQHFNLFEKDARSLVLVRARNEGIFQTSVILDPISALCEPLLGERDKILCCDHGQYPGNAFPAGSGQPNAQLIILREENDH
jgi:hypothetical protein